MADNTSNPNNPQSDLFKRLTRLFSGPIVNYRSQTGRRLRRTHLDKYAVAFKSASGKQFKRTVYNPFDNLAAAAISSQGRSERYVDFDQMEYVPEIASALDIYADEMTTSSDLQPMLRINCANEEIKAILQSLYHNVLNVEFNLFGWCRTMCKYGDFFLYLDIDEFTGIKSAIGIPPQEVERLEGEDKTNPNYVQYQWNSAGLTFENWQVSHFRILGNDKNAPYGTSVLEAARRIWRQLTLLEDAMMAYRIVRSPERRVFYIDVGAIAPQDVEQYMQKVMTQMKRNQVVNENTGRVDLRYNPLSIEEDYFVPVRGGVSSKIESLPGATYTGDIDDVKYLRDKLFAALKVPASYLSRAEGAEEDKTTLAQKDVRFARTIQRLQRVMVSELEKIGIIHLYVMGYRNDDLLAFKLALNNPSKIAELQELEHWRVKFETASSATEGYFSKRWVAEKLFNMSEEEYVRCQREMFYDRKFEAQLEAVAEATAEAEAAALGLGAGDEDMGEMGDLEAEAGAEPGAGEDIVEPEGGGEEFAGEPEGEDDVLLAAPPEDLPPAKRDDSTPGRKHGGKRRRMRNQAVGEYGQTARSRQPGKSGYGSLDSLAGISPEFRIPGLFEENLSNYDKQQDAQEQRLFEVDRETKFLLESLEAKKLENKDT
tara:strand:+ start:3166 stop:5130 length:1965 start_codon:yes stop_codon:yes gene_type:complete